jgi:hypothetical protein
MDLNELASACALYKTKTNFDYSYINFLNSIDNSLDLNKPDHRKFLLIWLNSWACRQFVIDYHRFASEQIFEWYKNLKPFIPEKSINIWELADDDLDKIKILYDTLVNTPVSKKYRNNIEMVNHAGPTGAAKTLFALRPKSLILWDIPMRRYFNNGDNGYAYIKYIRKVNEYINNLIVQCKKNNFSIEELPMKIDRPYSTIPKLIDEYNWVTITKGWQIPKINKFMI